MFTPFCWRAPVRSVPCLPILRGKNEQVDEGEICRQSRRALMAAEARAWSSNVESPTLSSATPHAGRCFPFWSNEDATLIAVPSVVMVLN